MEYHGGRWFSDLDELLARVLPLIADPARMRAIGRAALEVLLAEDGVDRDRLGAVGLSAGGSIVLELARSGAPLRALAVVHPGLPDGDPDGWADVRASVLLGTGSEDPLCTPEQVLTFTRALEAAGVDWRATVYGSARHAFWHPPLVGPCPAAGACGPPPRARRSNVARRRRVARGAPRWSGVRGSASAPTVRVGAPPAHRRTVPPQD